MNKHTHVLITLIASIIYTIIAIVNNEDSTVWAYNLVFVIIFALIFGTILKIYLDRKVLIVKKDKEIEVNIEEKVVKNETENYFESLKD